MENLFNACGDTVHFARGRSKVYIQFQVEETKSVSAIHQLDSRGESREGEK